MLKKLLFFLILSCCSYSAFSDMHLLPQDATTGDFVEIKKTQEGELILSKCTSSGCLKMFELGEGALKYQCQLSHSALVYVPMVFIAQGFYAAIVRHQMPFFFFNFGIAMASFSLNNMGYAGMFSCYLPKQEKTKALCSYSSTISQLIDREPPAGETAVSLLTQKPLEVLMKEMEYLREVSRGWGFAEPIVMFCDAFCTKPIQNNLPSAVYSSASGQGLLIN
jgi:hypothetical protein